MKRLFTIIILSLMILFSACSKITKQNNKIYTTIYPVYSITKFIAGDKFEVERIVKGTAEPHSFEPQTQDIAEMMESRAVFYIGHIDEWAKKASEGSNVKIVEVSEGINKIEEDPHVWTSPKNAIIIAENIKNTLIEIDSVNKDYYEENFYKLKLEMERINEKFEKEKANLKRDVFVIAHPAFGYLARDFGLTQVALTGQEEVEEPSPKEVAKVIDFIKEKNIKYILFDRTENENIIRPVVEATGVEKLEIFGMGAVPQDVEKKENYVTLMEKNIDNIIKALKE
ncbi:metal ABC transporter substrate-binding protein [Caloramator sp. CAR-1]|uniref:metal ABC transporter substrate-binding protein n=1 Tax=Caloramator sp. CAR-1 TaxID=3062777 RepID=UPI0026E2AB59|nr:metal ABC transporter substrate-binding protein [Caloramator sp. CAR-1]MDO6355212.1 metal ABC transporter substrate-binding protein [Caloramator sp. CAR-1]